MSQTIIVTGSTGFIGSSLLGDIMRQDSCAHVRLLVRSTTEDEAYRRVIDSMAVTAPDADPADIRARCSVFLGDLRADNLGMRRDDLQRLATGATHIIHCASSVSFQQSLDDARSTNVEGARRMLALARTVHGAGSLQRFAYVSTAFVSGNRNGRIMEDDRQQPERFSNSYEQSKYEAESLVRSAMSELPCTILRPSIVVGHSQTGRTLCFNVLYLPLRLIANGLVREFGGSPDVLLDVVPVDFVSRAIYELSCAVPDAAGRTYHLTAADAAMNTGDIVRTALSYFRGTIGNREASLSFISPDPSSVKPLSRAEKTLSMFASYVSLTRIFDNSRTLEALGKKGIVIPEYAAYFERLFDYCIRTNWGRRMRTPAVAA